LDQAARKDRADQGPAVSPTVLLRAAPAAPPWPPAPAGRESWLPMSSLSHALALAFLVSLGLVAFVLFRLGGWEYYFAPAATRGYISSHKLLRPAGRVGEMFGIAGLVIMSFTLVYAARKKFRGLSRIGTTKAWLEIHIFCGLVGPVLVTLHTAMKFNGVVSIAYWSMVLVVLSGFVGRYLYVRIPKTLRGSELSLEELDSRAIELKGRLVAEGLPTPLLRRIEELEQGSRSSGFLLGDFALGRRLAHLHRELAAAGIAPARLVETDRVIRERMTLLRRIATLDTSKKLFHLWHVFHKPFVYVMLAIAVVHVAVALYFGYAGRW
jgi:hypothetical protein